MDQIPLSVTIKGATALTGLSKTTIYDLIAGHKLQAKKSGKRTLVTGASLKNYIENLPAKSAVRAA